MNRLLFITGTCTGLGGTKYNARRLRFTQLTWIKNMYGQWSRVHHSSFLASFEKGACA